MDLIDRQAAIDAFWSLDAELRPSAIDAILNMLNGLPSVQSEIIRCKDCRWWDKYSDYDNGYCMAAKHGYLSEHWDISIRRTYKGDFYCADAEPKGEQE